MSIGNALTFIKRAVTEPALRGRLNSASCTSELEGILAAEGLSFTPFEFEDAVNSSLVKCTEWEEADHLNEFRTWWEMLQQIVSPETCSASKGCSGGCCG